MSEKNQILTSPKFQLSNTSKILIKMNKVFRTQNLAKFVRRFGTNKPETKCTFLYRQIYILTYFNCSC